MGIAGCVVKEKFWNYWLGMRNEYVDMVEIERRVARGIFDQDEYEEAYAWRERELQGRARTSTKEWQRAEAENHEECRGSGVTKMTLIVPRHHDRQPAAGRDGLR